MSAFGGSLLYKNIKDMTNMAFYFVIIILCLIIIGFCLYNAIASLIIIATTTSKLKHKGSIATIGRYPSSYDLFPSGYVKAVYINDDGVIYKLKGCGCPLCEANPKGFMSFTYNKATRAFELKCNRNSQHKLPFDYTQKI